MENLFNITSMNIGKAGIRISESFKSRHFNTIAPETIGGISNMADRQPQNSDAARDGDRTYLSDSAEPSKSKQSFRFSNGPHGIWS